MNKKGTLSIAVTVLAITVLACSFSSMIPATAVALAAPATAAPTQVTSAGAPAVPSTTSGTTGQSANLVNTQNQLESIYAAILPGVVTVQTTNDLGSGIVYNSDGYIVTNAHVVGTETKVEVDFSDGTKVYGNVVGTDQNADLAAIKVSVPASELHPVTLGDLKCPQDRADGLRHR